MPGKRRNISVTDDVWERWEGAAAGAGAKRGMAMPVSEWLRVAAREKIERDYPAAEGVHIEGPHFKVDPMKEDE